MSDRVKRLCDVCGGYDDAPRHVRAVDEGGVPSQEFIDSLPDGVSARAIAEVLDPTSVVRHMDCCAENGCGTCSDVVVASGGAKDGALVEYLTSEA